MGRRLASTVFVEGPGGEMVSFGPDATFIPKWATEQITNPKVWVDDEPEQPTTEDEQPPSAPIPSAPMPVGADEPPKAGPGSGADAWIAHARHLGLTIADTATRGDAMQAVDDFKAQQGQQ